MKATYFNDIIPIGLNNLMPTKSVKLHSNDAPWMTGHLKLLIRQRQEALNEKNTHLLFFMHVKSIIIKLLIRERQKALNEKNTHLLFFMLCSIPEYLSKSLERVQRRALRIIYGYDYS